jgi:hypothetical protein
MEAKLGMTAGEHVCTDLRGGEGVSRMISETSERCVVLETADTGGIVLFKE